MLRVTALNVSHAVWFYDKISCRRYIHVKAAKYPDAKTLNLSRNIVSLQVLVDVSRFSPCMINLTFVTGQRNAALWLVDLPGREQICCAPSCEFDEKRATSALLFVTTFFNPRQMFLLRDKLITHGEKRETSTKTCNESMLRDKLRVFIARISPP